MKAATDKSLLHRVFSAVFFGVGGAVGSRVFMALANVLLSRVLGQDVYGQYSSLSTTVNLFVTFSGMGISATLTRYVAANPNDRKVLGEYIRTLSWLTMGMSLILTAAIAVFARQISILSTGGETLTVYFRGVALAVFLAAMSAVEHSIMLGFEQFAFGSLVQLIRCLVFCVLGYVLSVRYGLMGSVASLVISHAVQYVLMLVYNRVLIRKRQIPLKFSWNRRTRQAMFTFALPTFISGLFVLPVNWVGNAILTKTVGFAQVSVFSVASQWMTYITYIPSQMGQMRPIYTDLYTRGNRRQLRRLMVRTMLITSAMAVVIGAVVVLFSESILGIYGSGYKDGQYTLAFMVLAAVFYTAQVQVGFLMQAAGKMWIGFAANLIWAVTLLSTYVLLVDYEARGYAIAYATAYFVTLAVQLAVVFWILRRMSDQDEQ